MIKVYTGLKGSLISLFLIAGIILFLSIFCWGITKAIQLVLPVLIAVAGLLIIVFLLGILPATLFKHLRPSLAVYSVLMSHALGALTWMMSFFYVIKMFGFGGIFLAFLFQMLAPIAIVGEMLKGSWDISGELLLCMSFIYGMRFYSQWLISLSPRNQKKGDIIDVDIIDVENS